MFYLYISNIFFFQMYKNSNNGTKNVVVFSIYDCMSM